MKKVHLMLLGFLIFSACKKENSDGESITDPESNDSVWVKISVPNMEEVSAVYGNIDETLIIACKNKLYYSTDRGKNWTQSHEDNIYFAGFRQVKDTLLALEGTVTFGNTGNFSEYTNDPFVFSTDNGRTWASYHGRLRDVLISRSMINITNGLSFYIDYNLIPLNVEKTAHKLGPGKIYKAFGGTDTQVYFPFKRKIEYLYADKERRLYVCTKGYNFEGTDEEVVTHQNDPGLLYISKKPL